MQRSSGRRKRLRVSRRRCSSLRKTMQKGLLMISFPLSEIWTERGTELIIGGSVGYKDQIGFAVMNRMIKSAGYNVIKLPSAADR